MRRWLLQSVLEVKRKKFHTLTVDQALLVIQALLYFPLTLPLVMCPMLLSENAP